MKTVSLGEVKVSPPGLRGWKWILAAIPKEQYGTLVEISLEMKGQDSSPDLKKITERLAPLIVSIPDLAVAICRAVIRVPGRNGEWVRIKEEDVWDSLSEMDVIHVIQELLSSDFFKEVVETLKNYLPSPNKMGDGQK